MTPTLPNTSIRIIKYYIKVENYVTSSSAINCITVNPMIALCTDTRAMRAVVILLITVVIVCDNWQNDSA